MKSNIDKKRIQNYFSGNYSKEDIEYVENFFSSKNDEEELKNILKENWDNFRISKENMGHDLDHIFYRISEEIQEKRKNKTPKTLLTNFWKAYVRIAAVVLLPIGLLYFVFFDKIQTEFHDNSSYAEVSAPLGSRVKFVLPDGSEGWLNSGSSIKYPVKFGETRDVNLIGEAWFDVKKDSNRPFNVVASSINISVLGTQFNVSSYNGEKVDVVLETGKVKLTQENSDEEYEMEPKDRVVVNTRNNKVNKTKLQETEKYSSWKDGKLVFRNEALSEIAERLSRWYNVEVEIENEKNKTLKLRATFVDEDIEEVLRLLKMSLPIDYKIKQRQKDNNNQFQKRKVIISVT